MSWNDLSMKDRASYIKLGIENGITDLDTIRGIYNKFALGGDTKDSSKYIYIYADSDTTDPNFTDLTPVGEGVYKNKFGKIVYDTTKVTPPKKDKSINDNWQTAYAKGVPSGTMSADMETMNAVNRDYPYVNKKPTVRFTPYKQFARKNPDAAAVFNSNKNEVTLPATWDPFNPHVLIDTSTPNTKGILVHEIHHQFQDVIPRFRDLDMELPSNRPFGYSFHINSKRPEVTNVFGPLRANNGWAGSVKEFQSEVANSKYLLNNPANFDNQPLVNQDKMVDMLSKRFYINPKWTREMLHRQSVYGYAEGGPLKKSYKDFSTRLSKAWHNQDLSQDDYDYQKYYNDDPEEAYRQLESIEKGGQGHFPDEGRSGIYKTSNHPTYPDLGANSWLNNDRIFNMSARQAVPENTDRVLDYLGYDLGYNKGGTKAMYNGAYQLPEVTITPNGNYTELIPNELGTGWMYRNRAGRFDDFNYDYVNRYERNQKALGGNLFADGGKKATRYRSSSNIRKQISTWEGSTMRTNVPFDRMDTMFNQVLPEGALEKLSQEQLDGLYSFAYNVGTGIFKTRTAPTLSKYLAGQATLQDVQNTMWAAKDSKLRGLANRRKKERSMLGAYVPVQEAIPMTTPLDITPAVQPIIESNPVIQDNIETLPLAFNTESQKESYYTPGFFDYVNYINQIRQPKQRDRRIWLTI